MFRIYRGSLVLKEKAYLLWETRNKKVPLRSYRDLAHSCLANDSMGYLPGVSGFLVHPTVSWAPMKASQGFLGLF